MRLAVFAVAVVLLAGCGVGSTSHGAGAPGATAQNTRADFDRHLQQDGLVLYRASAVLRPPPSKSIPLWAAELRAAHPRVHAAVVDLSGVKAPSNARADTKVVLRGFRFTDTLIARLARDAARRDRAAILRDASSLQARRSEAIFGPFRSAVRDLRRKGYTVGVLSR